MKDIKPRRAKLQDRNAAILKDFVLLYGKGFRPDIIYKKLSNKYFIAVETVNKIITREAKTTNVEKRPT